MGKHYSVYISDDELCQWVDRISDEVFDGDSATFKKAAQLMRRDYDSELSKLKNKRDDDIIT